MNDYSIEASLENCVAASVSKAATESQQHKTPEANNSSMAPSIRVSD